ncbi:MAG: hypothetical protein ACXVHJ_32515 [Solirubrobacteraceae bacterium]
MRTRFDAVVGGELVDAGFDEVVVAGAAVVEAGIEVELVGVVELPLFFPLLQAPSVATTAMETRTRAETTPG